MAIPANDEDPVSQANPQIAADPGLERPWLAHYPPGVPAAIDVGAVPTLVEVFKDSVARFAERPALESFGVRMTYAELGRAADAVAAWLQTQGFGKGDRIGIMMPNVLAYPAVLFGALSAGCAVVNINPLYTARELIHQLNDSGARVLFLLENFAHTVEQAGSHLTLDRVVIVSPGDLMGPKGLVVNLVSRFVKRAVPRFSLPGSLRFGKVLAAGRGASLGPVAVGPDDIAFLQYTGGTTGVAKGAVLLHRNVGANLVQVDAWLRSAIGDGSRTVMVTALPLYHIFALTSCAMVMTRIGAMQLLVANARDLPGLVKLLQTRPFTALAMVNTLYNALLNEPGVEKVDFSKLSFCVSGGMATQAAVAQRWKALTGKPIVEGYGLSETSPTVCVNRLDIEAFTGTIGYPVPSTDVSIRSETGEPVPRGEPGELCVKGPQVMAGYWNRPDETARAMTADGYFRTGDVAVLLPDGQVKLVDRIKDMILVSGFNVYPNEVEDVLAAHPGVLEAAVVGAPDAHSGEAVVAYVVRKDPSLTEDAVRAHARELLAPYKIPKRVVFRETLPKTNVGKVLRRALREHEAA